MKKFSSNLSVARYLLASRLMLAVFVGSIAASADHTSARETDDRPNVILIMTDDQGYGDLSITGNTLIETPHMDRIAKEGAWLKNFYVSPVCTPTRAHLMTGRYGFRTRAIDTFMGRAVMEPNETTVAEVLSGAGYSTGIFGKWHLGDCYPTRAMDQGFQESLVHQGGGLRQPANPPEGERYHDPILFHNGKPKQYEGYCTDIFFDQAATYIEKQAKADRPFFAYISTNAPHGPFDEPPTRELLEHFESKSPPKKGGPTFYAMVKNIDDNVGRLLAKLEKLEIEKETLVIFLTDNGPSSGSAGPFRGNKASVFEGGIRTVCFLRWPGKINAGTTSSRTAAHIDLMPTILDYCNATPKSDVKSESKQAELEWKPDGRSVRPLIEDSANADWPDRYLFLQWHRGNVPARFHHFAAIGPQGRWKLINRNTRIGQHQLNGEPEFTLYDLQNDVGEQKDVAAANPEITKRMIAEYEKWFDDVCSTREPNFGMPPIAIGAREQRTVVLTPQDKRLEIGTKDTWRSPGWWPVDVRREGPYTVEVLLNRDTKEDINVTLTIEVDGKETKQKMTVVRGLDSVGVGNVNLPAIGLGKVTCQVDDGQDKSMFVLHVTFK